MSPSPTQKGRSPLAGKPAPRDRLVNVQALVASYYTLRPDPEVKQQRVSFGTSGHRGSSLDATFNEDHVLAVSKAVCEYRRGKGIDGPLFLGFDSHALSEPAFRTAIEVFSANDVDVVIAADHALVPTPVISHAILVHNAGLGGGVAELPRGSADGVILTPSHNPPGDGGYKYNPPSGGPAGQDATGWIERRANELLAAGTEKIARSSYTTGLSASTTHHRDLIAPYVDALAAVLDMDAIRNAGLRIGVDPLGGAGLPYWHPIAERWGLDLTVVNPVIDPTFSFMPLDHDGEIRMDCSSPDAMAGLIGLQGDFDIAFGNDPDADRHGIVCPGAGLMNPNHYLSVAVDYLFRHRPDWGGDVAVGKTLVTSSMIDRVAATLGRTLQEVPVGFKYFVDGLHGGNLGFGGEESAGASFLRRDGSAWTTDKDGLLLGLLAAEVTAVTGRNPAQHYRALCDRLGDPLYARRDVPATPAQKAALRALSPESLTADSLAGEAITAKLTRAPGNNEPIGGLKVVTANGWFAARPSGTEDVYKVYAESFLGNDHLARLQDEAMRLVAGAFDAAGV